MSRLHPLRVKKILRIAGLSLLAITPFIMFFLLLPENSNDEPTLKGPSQLAFPYTEAEIQFPPTDFLPEATAPAAEVPPEPNASGRTTRKSTGSASPKQSTASPPPPVQEQPAQVIIRMTQEEPADPPNQFTPPDKGSGSDDDNDSGNGFLEGDPTGLGSGSNDPSENTSGPPPTEGNQRGNENGTNEAPNQSTSSGP
jgi:hypothetical protein